LSVWRRHGTVVRGPRDARLRRVYFMVGRGETKEEEFTDTSQSKALRQKQQQQQQK